jgi:hypothetical protein
MAQNLFKTRYLPNQDGTESTTALTNSNCAFVHTVLGDDYTGDGTREKPYQSMNKALQLSKTCYLFRGTINEYWSVSNQSLIGDDKNQVFIQSQHSPSSVIAFNLTSDVGGNRGNTNCIILNKTKQLSNYIRPYYNLMKNGTDNTYNANMEETNDTWNKFYLVSNNNSPKENKTNNLYINCLFRFFNVEKLTVLNYCVFNSSSVFRWINTNCVQPAWTNDSVQNIQLAKDCLKAAGMPQAYIDGSFLKDIFDNETCKIIKEIRCGGSHPNILNKYGDNLTGALSAAITANSAKTSITLIVDDTSKFPTEGNIFLPFIGDYIANGVTITNGYEVFTYTSVIINSSTSITFNGASYTFKMAYAQNTVCTRYGDAVDFTLNPDPLNEALWASNIGGYVGCFPPSQRTEFADFDSAVNVNSDGSEGGGAGDLLQVTNGQLVFNESSTQTWNRIKSNKTFHLLLGQNFDGAHTISQDGALYGFYLGKYRDLINPTKIYAGETLTVGKRYRVYNDGGFDIEKAIYYNNVLYLPRYTFVCVSGVTTFSLLNEGSGTYVREVLADPMESIEVIPYDDMNTPSIFPKFSAPLANNPLLIFYTATGATRYGHTQGTPVLFSHLKETNFIADFGNISDKIAYYDNFAVSNADPEFYLLTNAGLSSQLRGYFTQSIPVIRYLRISINGHKDDLYKW